MNKLNEVECWGIQLLVENDMEPMLQILEAAKEFNHFVGIYPIGTKAFNGGILLFDDRFARNRAFLELKKYNSLLVQVTANFRSVYVEEKYLKRMEAQA